jgi:hypothetical protein
MSDDTEIALVDDKYLPAEVPPPDKIKKRAGRPKGSKNKITLLKLMAEEAARTRNASRIDYVMDMIISQAARGDATSQKLVWQAVMSQGIPNESKGAEKLQINIGRTYEDFNPIIKEPDIVIIPTDVTPDEEVEDEPEAI